VALDLLKREERSCNDGNSNADKESKKATSEIEKTFKHGDFLESLTQRQSKNKHIAIAGEAGAGKTTLLATIAEKLHQQGQLTIFIGLAGLQDKSLYDYIYDSWLPEALGLRKGRATEDQKDDLHEQFKLGKIWLLLDGLDEMQSKSSTNALSRIEREIRDVIEQSKVVLTCRLNVWDVNLNGLSNFETFRMGKFSHDDIEKFISEWFIKVERPESAPILQAKLNEPNRDRIRDMVRHPLRLALLCQAFYRNPDADLPETKAGLYDRFVPCFYEWNEWKPNIVDEPLLAQDTLRNELHLALGKLAIAGIDGDAGFRLSRNLAVKEMGDRLFELAIKLNWLIPIERDENDRQVYSFFHATFQEYFAALTINESTYFLLNNPKHIPSGTYRIFEQQWREVGLFWIGDSNKDKKQKNSLINDLTNFQESGYCFSPLKYSTNKYFYGYHATFIAVILIGEYIDCSRETKEAIDTLMLQVSHFAFGCYDDEQQTWIRFLTPVRETAKWALSLTNFTRGNKELGYIKKDIEDIKKLIHLDKIEEAKASLESSFKSMSTSNYGFAFTYVTDINELLETIGFEVETIQKLINNRQIYKPMIALDTELQQLDLSNLGQDLKTFSVIASNLGLSFTNRIQDSESILSPASLVLKLIEDNFNSTNSLKTDRRVTEYDLKIHTDSSYKNPIGNIFYFIESFIFRNIDINQFGMIVNNLSKWIWDGDKLRSEEDDTLSLYILWRCSEVLSYPDFYQAWHPAAFPEFLIGKPELEYLENNLLSIDTIQTELDRNTIHPEIRCLVVDIRQLELERDPNIIAKKLTNKIFNSIGRRIPVVQDVSCLERELLNLRFDLGVDKLAIALYGKSANEAIHQLCQSLIESIPIRPFTGEKTSEQLTKEVKTWLRRINLEYN
jgi:Txe/YoeB family toxin of Txe-Axe toxin-antitoxin module/energy-coupling factor transporter ATP-binding protein EcfA2